MDGKKWERGGLRFVRGGRAGKCPQPLGEGFRRSAAAGNGHGNPGVKGFRGARVFCGLQRDPFFLGMAWPGVSYIHVEKDKRFPRYREKGKNPKPKPQNLTDAVPEKIIIIIKKSRIQLVET